ncbi:hypothetical protein EYZ11_006901 [Aspergillus tanneri]|uniref:Uncharacterized protein n=1 Tax=Aspergillus tanneri TaxID=1220188 RepID=A0A4S3JGK1_9EURO|nr:hypothetical protein EYZ11_006901 [Aspergillus tanneri]
MAEAIAAHRQFRVFVADGAQKVRRSTAEGTLL